MPGIIGEMIADSDLKDLGMHTELCSDAYYKIYEAGKLTNKYSTLNKGQGNFGNILRNRKALRMGKRKSGNYGIPS